MRLVFSPLQADVRLPIGRLARTVLMKHTHTHLLALGGLYVVDLVVQQPRNAPEALPSGGVGLLLLLLLLLFLSTGGLERLERVRRVRGSLGVRVGKVVQELRVVREACGQHRQEGAGGNRMGRLRNGHGRNCYEYGYRYQYVGMQPQI